MAKETRTEFYSLEAFSDGSIAVKLAKVDFDLATGRILDTKWHRTVVEDWKSPDIGEVVPCSVAEQMVAVNAHLDQMGYPPVSDEDVVKIAAFREFAKAPSEDIAAAVGKDAQTVLAEAVSSVGAMMAEKKVAEEQAAALATQVEMQQAVIATGREQLGAKAEEAGRNLA